MNTQPQLKAGDIIINPYGYTEQVTKVLPGNDGKKVYTKQSKEAWYNIDKVTLISQ